MTVLQHDVERRQGWRIPLALFAVAFSAAILLEFWVERGEPLWLDEAWTIAIVGQHAWPAFFHQVYWDVNAPLYYLLMHLWQGAFGLSDLSLRVPSLIFAVAAPLAIAFSTVEGLPRLDRLAWAALTAIWFPALSFAQEARCYEMLLLVSTLQCIAFVRLLARPDLGRAAIWAAFAATSILTHYDAILSGAVQGLIYLAVHRLRAVKTWPAALAFVPAFGWLAYHLPRIAQFARPDIAWYSPLTVKWLPQVFGFLAGSELHLWGLLSIGTVVVVLRLAFPPDKAGERSSRTPLWLAVAAAVISAAILITLGFFRPSFAFRYLTPDAPGVLLGLVLAVRALGGRRTDAGYAVMIAVFLGLDVWLFISGMRMAPRIYNYEVASRYLERTHPARVVFLWDHPVDPILHPEQLDAAGGAFFRRDGQTVSVDPVVLGPDEEPNARLLADAAPPRSVILWVYDTVVQGTAATDNPPAISADDPAWRCRQFGRGRFGVYACARQGAGS